MLVKGVRAISKSGISERKKRILKRIEKLEQYIIEKDVPNIAKRAFEINLKHLREEYRKLEKLEI